MLCKLIKESPFVQRHQCKILAVLLVSEYLLHDEIQWQLGRLSVALFGETDYGDSIFPPGQYM